MRQDTESGVYLPPGHRAVGSAVRGGPVFGQRKLREPVLSTHPDVSVNRHEAPACKEFTVQFPAPKPALKKIGTEQSAIHAVEDEAPVPPK
jgi:hypothetical protein